MIGIIGLTLIYIVLSVLSIRDIYKNRNDLFEIHPLSFIWAGIFITSLIFILMLDADKYIYGK